MHIRTPRPCADTHAHTHTVVWIRVEQWAYWRPQLMLRNLSPPTANNNNDHATHWPCVHGPAASAGVWLRATESEISAVPMGQSGSGKDFSFYGTMKQRKNSHRGSLVLSPTTRFPSTHLHPVDAYACSVSSTRSLFTTNVLNSFTNKNINQTNQ